MPFKRWCLIFAVSYIWYIALAFFPNIRCTSTSAICVHSEPLHAQYHIDDNDRRHHHVYKSKNKQSKSGKHDVYGATQTCTCIVVLSKALNNKGRTSDRMSSRGVFSNITWRFSRMVTVAWIDLGATNMALWMHKYICVYLVNCIVFVWWGFGNYYIYILTEMLAELSFRIRLA